MTAPHPPHPHTPAPLATVGVLKVESLKSPPQLSPLAGRAGTAWRARAASRTRSRFVPRTTRTRRPASACLRWRRTSGAAQRSRSSRGQVSICTVSVVNILKRCKEGRGRPSGLNKLRQTSHHHPFTQLPQVSMPLSLFKYVLNAYLPIAGIRIAVVKVHQ